MSDHPFRPRIPNDGESSSSSSSKKKGAGSTAKIRSSDKQRTRKGTMDRYLDSSAASSSSDLGAYEAHPMTPIAQAQASRATAISQSRDEFIQQSGRRERSATANTVMSASAPRYNYVPGSPSRAASPSPHRGRAGTQSYGMMTPPRRPSAQADADDMPLGMVRAQATPPLAAPASPYFQHQQSPKHLPRSASPARIDSPYGARPSPSQTFASQNQRGRQGTRPSAAAAIAPQLASSQYHSPSPSRMHPAPASPHPLMGMQRHNSDHDVEQQSHGHHDWALHPPSSGRKKTLVRRDRAPYSHHAQRQRSRRNHPHLPGSTVAGSPSASAAIEAQGGAPHVRVHSITAPHAISAHPHAARRPPRVGDQQAAASRYTAPETLTRRVWVLFSRAVTFYAPPVALRWAGMHLPDIQQAWREKMALCSLFVLVIAVLGFLTFFFPNVVCVPVGGPGTGGLPQIDIRQIPNDTVTIQGYAFSAAWFPHWYDDKGPIPWTELGDQRDLGFLFQSSFANMPDCVAALGSDFAAPEASLFPCTPSGEDVAPGTPLVGNYTIPYCHGSTPKLAAELKNLRDGGAQRSVLVPWEVLQQPGSTYFAFNGAVIDLRRALRMSPPMPKKYADLLVRQQGRDASRVLNGGSDTRALARCLSQVARTGMLDGKSTGCVASDVVLYLSLMAIMTLVLSRFFMAIVFRWVLAPKLGKPLSSRETDKYRRFREMTLPSCGQAPFGAQIAANDMQSSGSLMDLNDNASIRSWTPGSMPALNYGADPSGGSASSLNTVIPKPPQSLMKYGHHQRSGSRASLGSFVLPKPSVSSIIPPPDAATIAAAPMYTILLVTCYSESADGIRGTLDSLADSDYDDSHKLLFVIADGIITGSGNACSTPDAIVGMMEKDAAFPSEPKPYSYVAIAEGAKRHNMAQVHAGYFRSTARPDRRVPMVCVVKCGTPEEAKAAKPGNRGKRDSQVVLMGFLQKIMFDERLTPLEYDLYQKIMRVTQVVPTQYEIVLMVDADTIVKPDALNRMVAVFARDPSVMGLCGETRIDNKAASWVTAIQVFEYYISHHLAKAFESVFGGVTCLPGCFCAWRIKTPKGPVQSLNSALLADAVQGDTDAQQWLSSMTTWVPILANPDIVEEYSENVVDTLHKKNLLLLGEDRYLTTLMLKNFPRRKILFVPQAVCRTTVPDSFSVLLSQRRRWINSTVHNLFELVLVRDLCGSFCLSMNFTIACELIGTIVLPAAITFTVYLIIAAIAFPPVPWIPLIMLLGILGLPGVLILVTTFPKDVAYLFWMIVYIVALPIWNLVLPVYAYWHFDDFSWGATRVVAGDDGAGHGAGDGEFDGSKIVMRKLCEWEQVRRKAIAQAVDVVGGGAGVSGSAETLAAGGRHNGGLPPKSHLGGSSASLIL